ncbi:TetR/AcrR family transcriptional regulator [Nonomuraea jabiensis]|uniref:AcrR family transcriptional regulator n=1 Tax=Nonomuraea jabiensis TaxID=882448 RepID=A0A7W9GH18_9ACTN|nr:helix-turn-helix domain-containing protein [Nonomuraea jabiensis]MBB5783571.1 AcrR family transcriptional regulator [Nonomuraea jabiensis]
MPPDKPLRADARRNRARVLQAAEAAFSAEGMAVPLDEIARRAGVGAGTVYRHFPSKEALFEAVIHDRIRQFADEARALSAAERPGEEFLAFLGRVIDQAMLNKALCDALEAAGSPVTPADGVQRDVWEAFGALLGAAQRAGAVRADVDVSDLRALLAGALAMERHARDSARPAGRLTALLLDALLPRA